MADTAYSLSLQKFIEGLIDLADDDIKVTLIDTDDYTANFTTDEYYDDIPAGAKVAESGNLTSKTTTLGVFDAADVTFSSVTGDQSEALVIWKDTGVASTSPLICYIDSPSEFPVTPNGGDITVQWSDGANKIFKFGPA